MSQTKQDEKTDNGNNEKKIILIDMDGVCADIDAQIFLKTGFDISDRKSPNIPSSCEAKVKEAWSKPGFFLTMPLIKDALESINKLFKNPLYSVWFCTSPLTASETCASEKILWIKKHFGSAAAKRVIITDDKTLVNGWILIDDRDPVAKGCFKPLWKHVIFNHSSNQNLSSSLVRMNGWKDMERVLKQLN